MQRYQISIPILKKNFLFSIPNLSDLKGGHFIPLICSLFYWSVMWAGFIWHHAYPSDEIGALWTDLASPEPLEISGHSQQDSPGLVTRAPEH